MKLIADNQWTYINGTVPSCVHEATSYLVDGCWFHPLYKQKKWDGKIRLAKYDRQTGMYRFPSGMLSRVVKSLEQADYRYTLEDNRIVECVNAQYQLHDDKRGSLYLDRGNRDYQRAAVDAALLHGRGIIKLATGGGKTEVGAAIVKSINRQTMWLVHRENLLHQTIDRLKERLQRPIGILGDGQCDLQQITVTMCQTAAKAFKNEGSGGKHDLAVKWLTDCQVIIADEVHHVESDQQYGILERMTAPWRIGLSATPHLDGAGMAVEAMTGHILIDIPASELIRRGVLVQPFIWFVEYEQPKFDKDAAFSTVYSQGIAHWQPRNAKICDIMAQCRYEEKPVLTLVNRLNHGKAILEEAEKWKLRVGWVHGKVDRGSREALLEKLWNKELDSVVAVAETLGEGSDLPALKALINATGQSGGGNVRDGDSGRRTIQFLGRGLRPYAGKTRFDYFDFFDHSTYNIKQATLGRIETFESEGYQSYINYYRNYVPC